MQRVHVFLIVLIATIAVLLALVAVSWYLSTTASSYYNSSWMSQMWGSMSGNGANYGGMGGMMGGGSNGGSAATQSYFWLIPVTLIAVSAVAVVGFAFYWAFPELKYIRGKTCTTTGATSTLSTPVQNTNSAANVSGSCDVLLKTLMPDEQKVLNVLIAHQGKYLQKYVVKESGLSRLKTHRIIARFAQRGIVTVTEFGNTNEISLSDWVKGSASSANVQHD